MEFSAVTSHFYWRQIRRSRSWRLLGTAIAFGAFGAGAGIFSFTLFPILYFLPINSRRKHAYTRKLIGFVFRHYLWMLKFLGLITYEFHSIEKLRIPNQLFIANHPSLLDVVFIISLTGDANCVVKSSLWRNPFTAMGVRAAGYISNTDENMFQDCMKCLVEGQSLIIFPEGTRTRPGEPLKFHRGPSNIALSSHKAITPVTIRCEPATLLKNQQWYKIPAQPSHYTFKACATIDTTVYMANGQLQSAAARQLTRDLVNFFTTQTCQLTVKTSQLVGS